MIPLKTFVSKTEIWMEMDDFLFSIIPFDKFSFFYRAETLIRRSELEEELDFAEQYLEGLDFPTVNSHDDFHNRNVLYDSQSGDACYMLLP